MTSVAAPQTGSDVASTETTTTADSALAPSADCIADSAGGLTFDITDPGEPGTAHLLLRLRDAGAPTDGADRAEHEVRLPLTPSADGRLRAALPSSMELAEGRWDAYVEVPGTPAPRRLVPGVNDLRSLVDRAPSGARGHVAVRIPYPTKHGNLTVRSWHRAPHAEVGEIGLDQAGAALTGRVYGTGLTGQAYVEARRRSEPHRTHRAEVTARGPEFTATVDFGELADSGAGTWDLWLHPAGESGPRVRLARILDDVADKKAIFLYPTTRVVVPQGVVEAGPYYTTDNDLSIRVVEAKAAG
ncbi:hypothetical protein [Streptomyces sp. NPDC059009]|uniref:hypothetical protein n=1 Tax=Streptomyces sp. NPDC059009 TaxID=3346694 RepID=UPI0036B39327